MVEFLDLKTEGNQLFKNEKYSDAVKIYMKALELDCVTPQDKDVLYKNQAQCYLKLGKYQEAVDVTTKALEISPNDPKSLYRRCQAYENLNKLKEAYEDAAKLFKLDPKNKVIYPIVKRLEFQVNQKQQEKNSLLGKIDSMLELVKDKESPKDKLETAVNNLITLVRDDNAASRIWNNDKCSSIYELCQTSTEPVILEATYRLLGMIAKDDKMRGVAIFEALTAASIIGLLYSTETIIARAGGRLIQALLSSMTQIDAYLEAQAAHDVKRRQPGSKMRPYPKYELPKETKGYVDEGLTSLTKLLNSRKVSGEGRDCVMENLIRFIGPYDGINWVSKLVAERGIERSLEVASIVDPESKLLTTSNTRGTLSVLLNKVYDDLPADKDRDNFRDICASFVSDLLTDDILETKVQAASIIGILFQGPNEAASSVMAKEGLLEGLVMLAQSANPAHQKIALDTIILACQRKKNCSGVIRMATPVLRELYKVGSDAVKIRALVGLCKMGSSGGTDASDSAMADGSLSVLASACRKMMSRGDPQTVHWAVEGLVYLTLDADIKEDFLEDAEAVKSMFRLAQCAIAAAEALREAYISQTIIHTENAVTAIKDATINCKHAAAWKAINQLTGRKSKPTTVVAANSVEHRKVLIAYHYRKVLNAQPPQCNLLQPPGLQVPDLASFNCGHISRAEVIQALKATKS